MSGLPSTFTTTPFEAAVGSEYAEAMTHSNSLSLDMRLAARKGSIADEKANMENSGINKNPTFKGPAFALACKSAFMRSSLIWPVCMAALLLSTSVKLSSPDDF